MTSFTQGFKRALWLAGELGGEGASTTRDAQHTPGPINPYKSQGSLEEAWQRGFEGRPCLAYPGSNYAKVYAEGQVARVKAAGEQP